MSQSHHHSDRDYLTPEELAALTGFSAPTIYRWKRLGLIPCFQPGGKRGRIRFPPNAIECCLQLGSQSNEPSPASSDAPVRALKGRRPQWMSAQTAIQKSA